MMRGPRDPRGPGDPRDVRDPRRPDDPRDPRDALGERDPRDPLDAPDAKRIWRRIWPAVAGVAVSGVILAGVLYQNVQADNLRAERVHAICEATQANRVAAIEDARGQAQTLIEVAARNAEELGQVEKAKEIREVTGPAYVAAQVEAARDRRPEIEC